VGSGRRSLVPFLHRGESPTSIQQFKPARNHNARDLDLALIGMMEACC
jgi:hypothetical protein